MSCWAGGFWGVCATRALILTFLLVSAAPLEQAAVRAAPDAPAQLSRYVLHVPRQNELGKRRLRCSDRLGDNIDSQLTFRSHHPAQFISRQCRDVFYLFYKALFVAGLRLEALLSSGWRCI